VIILIYLASRELLFIADEIYQDIQLDAGVIERDQDSYIQCLGNHVILYTLIDIMCRYLCIY